MIESNQFYVRIIDTEGYFLRDDFVTEINELTIQTPCPAGFHKPKWDGEQWVEGQSAEYLEEVYLNSLKTSAEEVDTAEFEIKALTILMEMGLFE